MQFKESVCEFQPIYVVIFTLSGSMGSLKSDLSCRLRRCQHAFGTVGASRFNGTHLAPLQYTADALAGLDGALRIKCCSGVVEVHSAPPRPPFSTVELSPTRFPSPIECAASWCHLPVAAPCQRRVLHQMTDGSDGLIQFPTRSRHPERVTVLIQLCRSKTVQSAAAVLVGIVLCALRRQRPSEPLNPMRLVVMPDSKSIVPLR
ncbi:hypothetical protein C8R43DRAFT_958472 [Mycena crocata]|nr:hypothetical protein C8R43DRAFT_958472 [Mycena crocata]